MIQGANYKVNALAPWDNAFTNLFGVSAALQEYSVLSTVLVAEQKIFYIRAVCNIFCKFQQ